MQDLARGALQMQAIKVGIPSARPGHSRGRLVLPACHPPATCSKLSMADSFRITLGHVNLLQAEEVAGSLGQKANLCSTLPVRKERPSPSICLCMCQERASIGSGPALPSFPPLLHCLDLLLLCQSISLALLPPLLLALLLPLLLTLILLRSICFWHVCKTQATNCALSQIQ